MYPEYDQEELGGPYKPGKGAFRALWEYAENHTWRKGNDLVAVCWNNRSFVEHFSFLKDLVYLLGLTLSSDVPPLNVLAGLLFEGLPDELQTYIVVGFNDATLMFNAELAHIRTYRIFQQYEESQGNMLLDDDDQDEEGGEQKQTRTH